MGCLLRLGCLILLIIGGVIAWFTRDRWMDKLPFHVTPAVQPKIAADAPPDWAPLSEAGASRTREALQKLSTRNGPVFETLSGADVASYVAKQLLNSMPPSTDSVAAKVEGERIRLRAVMNPRELGSAVVSTLGSLMGDREHVEMAGTLGVIGKGMAEFRVTEVRVHDIGIPGALIPNLVKPMVRGSRPAGLSANAIPVAIPSYIGDVRIARGRITLYKNVQ
jgi:hypothetical protein